MSDDEDDDEETIEWIADDEKCLHELCCSEQVHRHHTSQSYLFIFMYMHRLIDDFIHEYYFAILRSKASTVRLCDIQRVLKGSGTRHPGEPMWSSNIPLALPGTWRCYICREDFPRHTFCTHVHQCASASKSQVRGFLGFNVNDKLIVTAVVNGSPAQNSGVVPGDVIRSANGVTLTTQSDFTKVLLHVRSESVVTLQVEREGHCSVVVVHATEPPSVDAEHLSPRPKERGAFIRRVSELIHYDADKYESPRFAGLCKRAFWMRMYASKHGHEGTTLPINEGRRVMAVLATLLEVAPPLCEKIDTAVAGMGELNENNIVDVCRTVFAS
eukprot:PhF_6_TR22681/c0_g1_i1/m.32294